MGGHGTYGAPTHRPRPGVTAAVVDAHRRAWGVEPEVIASTPGRVNLMGDHVDYALLPVLPVAIQLRLQVAAGRAGDGRVHGMSSLGGGKLTFTGGEEPAGWFQYVAAAVRAAGAPAEGAVLTVDGDLPHTGGLSSSSALVLAVLAALLKLQGQRPPPGELVALAVAAERSLGIAGGTMDQTVIVHAVAGSALRIDFAPPGLRAVPIPEEVAFVVASSGTTAAKGGSARDAYNTLSIGARVVAALAGRRLGVDPGSPPALGTLGVQAAGLCTAIESLPATISLADAAEGVGRSPSDLAGESGLAPTARLPVAAIGAHLIGEARRVDATEAALREGDITELGAIMGDSHESLRRLGTVTAGLDRVTEAMSEGGAAGARVTGAGFGGYAVGVCARDRVPRVLAAADDAIGEPAFVVRPSEGLSYD